MPKVHIGYINLKIIPLLLLVCSSALFFQACYRELNFPKTTIPEEKMIAVLCDVHLAEAKIADFVSWPVPARDSIAANYYNTIFELNGVKAEEFNQNMEAYMKNPEALSKLYEKVLSRLQKEESESVKK